MLLKGIPALLKGYKMNLIKIQLKLQKYATRITGLSVLNDYTIPRPESEKRDKKLGKLDW